MEWLMFMKMKILSQEKAQAGIQNSDNTFKFKDIEKSKRRTNTSQGRLLKSIPFDDNNSLNWTISGDIFVDIFQNAQKIFSSK